jgi:Flp pilus assembly protein TadB
MWENIKTLLYVVAIAIVVVGCLIAGYFLAILAAIGVAICIIYVLVTEYRREGKEEKEKSND